jgi:hypothetical protein
LGASAKQDLKEVREKLEGWLELIRTMWLERPALIDE